MIVTDEQSKQHDQMPEPAEKKTRLDDTDSISDKLDERVFQCAVCKNSKKINFFPSTSVFQKQPICKKCIGGLIGDQHYPSCRVCGKIGECRCNRRITPAKKCTKCDQVKERDSFLDENWFSGTNDTENNANIISKETNCMDCLSSKKNKLIQQWMQDRSVVFRLMRYGIQMFDCDTFLYNPGPTLFGDLPSMEDILGKYDTLFAKWESDNLGAWHDSDFGDFLLKRVMSGTVELKSDQNHGEGYESIVGKVLFDEAKFYGDNKLACDCPFGKIISFRFSEEEDGILSNISTDVSVSSITANGEDESCNVAVIANRKDLNGFDNFDDFHGKSSWCGSYGSSVQLNVIARRVSFDWIPRDYYTYENPYAELMRQEISHHRSRGKNWSHSWLSSHMNLPESIIQIIYDFITFIPDSNFTLEQDDISLSFEFKEYDCGLKVNVMARRK